jgi:D-aminopeptidase
MGGYTVGVLVQTNYGGILDIAGVPVGKELGRYAFKETIDRAGDGSCMIVVATDAPVSIKQLQRLASRAPLALGRTGSSMSHGSGDYVIAFSIAADGGSANEQTGQRQELRDDFISPLFQAVVEATEEAIINSLFKATDTKGYMNRSVEALPLEKTKELFRKYGRIR